MSRYGRLLASSTIILVGLGTVMVLSVSGPHTGAIHPLFVRHLLYIAIGSFSALLIARLRPETLIKNAHFILWGVCFVCFLTLVPGIGLRVRGAARWLVVGPLRFQPSELAKFAVIVYAARLSQKPPITFGSFLKALLPLPLLGLLIFAEPDIGTAVFICFCGGLFFWFAGARLKHLLTVGLVAAAALLPFTFLKFEHVRHRLFVFLNPKSDPLGRGYQLRQSLIAIGSGGPTGKGLGASEQKLFFLPDRNTDFIFSILAEETGLFGSLGVLLLFALFLVSGLGIASRLEGRAEQIMAAGAAFIIPLQAAINIAVVTGSLPTKGIPLPFLSFGGSSLVVSLLLVGVLIRLDMEGVECGSSLREAEVVVT